MFLNKQINKIYKQYKLKETLNNIMIINNNHNNTIDLTNNFYICLIFTDAFSSKALKMNQFLKKMKKSGFNVVSSKKNGFNLFLLRNSSFSNLSYFLYGRKTLFFFKLNYLLNEKYETNISKIKNSLMKLFDYNENIMNFVTLLDLNRKRVEPNEYYLYYFSNLKKNKDSIFLNLSIVLNLELFFKMNLFLININEFKSKN